MKNQTVKLPQKAGKNLEESAPEMEKHPLEPFLPDGARLLMLGSFPPQHKRWSMEFFYPNIQNDMWRIFGLLFFENKDYFYDAAAKKFKLNLLTAFLVQKGIAIYDTASVVKRLKNNASDKFLEVVEETDIAALLQKIPACKAVCVTGEKAAGVLAAQMNCDNLQIGRPLQTVIPNSNRPITLYRMPSSSRSYPLALQKKAEIYQTMLQNERIL